MKRRLIFLVLIFLSFSSYGQIDFLKSVAREQLRIDAMDGKADSNINMGTIVINQRANGIYIDAIDTFRKNIDANFPNVGKRNLEVAKTLNFVKSINYGNYERLSYYERCFKIINSLYDGSSDEVCLAICKSYQKEALILIKYHNYISDRKFAEDFLLYAGKEYPYETLGASLGYKRAPYLENVVRQVSYQDPYSTKQYLGTGSPVSKVVVNSQDPVLKKITEIYGYHGQSSNSFKNIDALLSGRLSLVQSQNMTSKMTKWNSVYLDWLIEERRRLNLKGSRSIERGIHLLSHLKVDDVNELHDNPNEGVRFRTVASSSPQQIYTLMVYTQEEIYTSSFLGLYKRMKSRLKGQSGYQFLKTVDFNRFRTFIKECAGFNTLDDFFGTMTLSEKDSLLDLVIDDLDSNPGDIVAAVEVADIFGSLTDTFIANTFRHKIFMDYVKKSGEGNSYGEFIYGMLYKLCGGDASRLTPLDKVSYTLPDLTRLSSEDMFSDGQNIQQHLFFDDEDGTASYRSFINSFAGDPNWRIVDQYNYVCIRSKKGFPVMIFANKPSREAQGQEELAKLFAAMGRYPDVAVHRGHSYYLDGTIDILNQSTKVAILGSCGGYHQVAKALENAQDVQIVSTKQIGTMSVNDVLIKDMSEVLRKHGTLDWKPFWLDLEKKLKGNSKFYDYIPPYKNLGAMLIKAYRMALENGELEAILS
ncbi:hypothetical protein OAB01_02465 [Bacteroidia bacterium]|nr:hypothetical protein [Bacteroidia bacterium]